MGCYFRFSLTKVATYCSSSGGAGSRCGWQGPDRAYRCLPQIGLVVEAPDIIVALGLEVVAFLHLTEHI